MISFQPSYYVGTPALLSPSRHEYGYQSSAVAPCFFENNVDTVLSALQRHNYASPPPPKIKPTEDQRSYYVKMSKKSGDFSDYGVKVYQDQKFTHVWVFSTSDNIKRHFKYPNSAVQYEGIRAKVARNGRFLLIQIPKIPRPEVVLNIVQKRLQSIANQERKEREEIERRELQRKAAIERNRRLRALEEQQLAAQREYYEQSFQSAFSPFFAYRLETKQDKEQESKAELAANQVTARPSVIRIPVNHVDESNEVIPTKAPRAPKDDIEERPKLNGLEEEADMQDVEEKLDAQSAEFETEQYSDFEGFSDDDDIEEPMEPMDEHIEDSDNVQTMEEPEILKRRPSPYSISFPSSFSAESSPKKPSKTKQPNKIPIEEVEDEEFKRFSSSSDSDC
ncbi:BA75_03240T0 [Komagataella pastoris]|uniref:BA75_03240T0 n=1 Tax=Komagataella pastoris TaxID=4922 RepID=A0A1B2JCZ1_PICPA|nr:BA75_03240T0 [Komagataella pastoris]